MLFKILFKKNAGMPEALFRRQSAKEESSKCLVALKEVAVEKVVWLF